MRQDDESTHDDGGVQHDDGSMRREAVTRRIEEYVLGAAITALGVFTLIDTATIVVPTSANTMGPRTFPYMIGGLLVAAGLAVLIASLTGRLGAAEQGEDVDTGGRTDWLTVVLLAAFFLAHVWLIDRVGWPLAVTVLFAGAALTLKARPWWRPVVIGLAMGLVLQAVFASGLGLSLPAGPFDGIPLFHG